MPGRDDISLRRAPLTKKVGTAVATTYVDRSSTGTSSSQIRGTLVAFQGKTKNHRIRWAAAASFLRGGEENGESTNHSCPLGKPSHSGGLRTAFRGETGKSKIILEMDMSIRKFGPKLRSRRGNLKCPKEARFLWSSVSRGKHRGILRIASSDKTVFGAKNRFRPVDRRRGKASVERVIGQIYISSTVYKRGFRRMGRGVLRLVRWVGWWLRENPSQERLTKSALAQKKTSTQTNLKKMMADPFGRERGNEGPP